MYGARQIGKSTSIHDFIIHNYENTIEIDFKKQPEYKAIFNKGYEPDKVLKAISIIKLESLDDLTHKTLSEVFKDYIFTGGMPKAVQTFINEKNFFNVFQMQIELVKDYEDDIIQYVEGLDISKVKTIYRSITPQLAKDNHKFKITKLPHKPRSRDY